MKGQCPHCGNAIKFAVHLTYSHKAGLDPTFNDPGEPESVEDARVVLVFGDRDYDLTRMLPERVQDAVQEWAEWDAGRGKDHADA